MKQYIILLLIFIASTVVSAGPYSSSINQGPYSSNINKIEGNVTYNITNINQNITVNGTSLELNDLTDVQVPSPSDGESLVWDSGIMKWISETVISRWIVSTANGFLYNDSDTLYFNDTKLNDTILAVAGSAADNTYDIYFNSSKKSIILYNLTDSDSSIITVHTVAGQKIIYGETFE